MAYSGGWVLSLLLGRMHWWRRSRRAEDGGCGVIEVFNEELDEGRCRVIELEEGQYGGSRCRDRGLKKS